MVAPPQARLVEPLPELQQAPVWIAGPRVAAVGAA